MQIYNEDAINVDHSFYWHLQRSSWNKSLVKTVQKCYKVSNDKLNTYLWIFLFSSLLSAINVWFFATVLILLIIAMQGFVRGAFMTNSHLLFLFISVYFTPSFRLTMITLFSSINNLFFSTVDKLNDNFPPEVMTVLTHHIWKRNIWEFLSPRQTAIGEECPIYTFMKPDSHSCLCAHP